MLRAKLRQDPRDHLTNRADAICQILLTHDGGEATGGCGARCGKVEQMARDALADRGERIACQLFEHVIQAMNRFFRQDPGNRRIVAPRSFDAIEIEKEGSPRHKRLHEDGSRSADERRHTQKIASANISHGHLPTVARMHIHAKQTVQDDGQAFRVRFRVNSVARCELRDPPVFDERFDRLHRQRRPTSALKETNDVDRCFPRDLNW